MFGKSKDKDPGEITPEEKELLRIFMETPGLAEQSEFFRGMSNNTPSPEFFMRGRPEPWWLRPVLLTLIIVGVGSIVGCVVLSWGR